MGFFKPNVQVFLILCFAGLTGAFGQDRPRKPFQLHEEAERAHNEGDFQTAIALLDECIKIDPGYLEAYALRGSAREQVNDLDGALTDYSIYLDRYPDHLDVLMSRATLRYRIGFYEQAREDFLMMLKIPSPGETNALYFKKEMSVNDRKPVVTTTQGAHTSYVLNYLGLTEARLGNADRAVAYYDSAIRLNPQEADYFVNRGLVKGTLRDSAAAVQDFERALQINPEHTLAMHNLKAARGKTISSEERLTQTIEADSTMLYPYLERAQQRYESKYYEGALDDYSRALEIDSLDVEIWLGRGLAREKLKDYKGAYSDYTRAIDLQENFAKAWLNRGNVLLKLERYEDAIEDYTVALIYYPDYPLAFYNRAMARFKLKRSEEACADLKQAEAFGMNVDARVRNRICDKP